MNRFCFLPVIFMMVSSMTGCATLTAEGTVQNITVLTYTPDGKTIVGVNCEMTNDEGMWTTVTPNSTMVHRSNRDLKVLCTKDGFSKGFATVVSKAKSNMWGNLVVGGPLGAIIDHNNGSAYAYPTTLKVYMGQSQRIEINNNRVDSISENESVGFSVRTSPNVTD